VLFRLFKKVYVELDTSFLPQSPKMFDCLVMSSEIKVPNKDKVVASYSSYLGGIGDFGFDPTKFFNALFEYNSHRSLMVYVSKVGFAQIVTQYWQHLYPNADPSLYRHFYQLTTDRISLIYSNMIASNGGMYLDGIKTCQLPQSEYQVHCENLFPPSGSFSEDTLRRVPFEYHYGDHFHSDRFSAEFKKSLRSMVGNDLRYLFLEIKDYLLARSSNFSKFFPHIKQGESFVETYRDPFFKICFDPNVVSFSGGGEDDLSDVQYVLDTYGVEYLKELFRTVNEIEGELPQGKFFAVLPTGMLNTQRVCPDVEGKGEVIDKVFEYVFERKARAFMTGDYSELLQSGWLDSTGSYRLFRRRYNYLLLGYMRRVRGPKLGE
jgi:hypothetical protein